MIRIEVCYKCQYLSIGNPHIFSCLGELAKQIKASREAIGKYERNEAVPSVETAKNIADVLEVSLDYLAGDVLKPDFDKKMMERLKDFEILAEEDKKHLLALLDAFLRDAKTKKAYA